MTEQKELRHIEFEGYISEYLDSEPSPYFPIDIALGRNTGGLIWKDGELSPCNRLNKIITKWKVIMIELPIEED